MRLGMRTVSFTFALALLTACPRPPASTRDAGTPMSTAPDAHVDPPDAHVGSADASIPDAGVSDAAPADAAVPIEDAGAGTPDAGDSPDAAGPNRILTTGTHDIHGLSAVYDGTGFAVLLGIRDEVGDAVEFQRFTLDGERIGQPLTVWGEAGEDWSVDVSRSSLVWTGSTYAATYSVRDLSFDPGSTTIYLRRFVDNAPEGAPTTLMSTFTAILSFDVVPDGFRRLHYTDGRVVLESILPDGTITNTRSVSATINAGRGAAGRTATGYAFITVDQPTRQFVMQHLHDDGTSAMPVPLGIYTINEQEPVRTEGFSSRIQSTQAGAVLFWSRVNVDNLRRSDALLSTFNAMVRTDTVLEEPASWYKGAGDFSVEGTSVFAAYAAAPGASGYDSSVYGFADGALCPLSDHGSSFDFDVQQVNVVRTSATQATAFWVDAREFPNADANAPLDRNQLIMQAFDSGCVAVTP